jgi:hypothetical protein
MYRVAIIAVAALIVIAGTARPVSAASPWQLCLRNEPADGANTYYLNFTVQGNAILVSGTYGRAAPDTHGPVFGTLARVQGTLDGAQWELGLTVTIANMGDYGGPNTENIVFTFPQDGTIGFKRWISSSQTFQQGFMVPFNCPAQ